MRLALGGLVSALALTLAPAPASASASCDAVCRVVEITKPFFCIRDLTC